MWENDKILFKFNLVEEVKSLAVEKSTIYTARDLDAVVTEIMAGKSGKYSTKATIPGRAPLALIGPIVDERRSFFVFGTRDGKGVVLTKNLPGEKFAVVWTKEVIYMNILLREIKLFKFFCYKFQISCLIFFSSQNYFIFLNKVIHFFVFVNRIAMK